MKKIRELTADEIDCRVQSVSQKGCILLLYKNARVDMALLDEVYGPNNWQRTHEVINGNLFCNIDIWDADKKTWVRKQDVGVESNTEKEKGQASDAFKRAGFNIGIGRELYTAPFIWINLASNELITRNGKQQLSPRVRFSVKEIGYTNSKITKLVIIDQTGRVRYRLGDSSSNNNQITDREEAFRQVALQKDVSSLENLWYRCEMFHTDKEFTNAVIERKKKCLKTVA